MAQRSTETPGGVQHPQTLQEPSDSPALDLRRPQKDRLPGQRTLVH